MQRGMSWKLACLLGIWLLAVPLMSGCGHVPSVPAPQPSEILGEVCRQLREFLKFARDAKQLETVRSELSITLEGLEAQAEQFGGKLSEIHQAALELHEQLSGVGNYADALPLLDKLEAKVNELDPAR